MKVKGWGWATQNGAEGKLQRPVWATEFRTTQRNGAGMGWGWGIEYWNTSQYGESMEEPETKPPCEQLFPFGKDLLVLHFWASVKAQYINVLVRGLKSCYVLAQF